MARLDARMPASPFIRFLLSGGLNTAVTYALYLLLLQIMPYWLAYSAAFAAGIVLAYTLNRCFVFRQHRGAVSVLGLPLVYAVQYGLGLVVLWCWVMLAGFDARWGPMVVVAVTVPLTYLFTRVLFVGRRP